MLHLIGIIVLFCLISLAWNGRKIDAMRERREKFEYEEYMRKRAREDLETQLKIEKLEALRRQNRRPPNPLEPV